MEKCYIYFNWCFRFNLIWIFIYDSPREYIENKNYKKAFEILEGIASFNGKLEEFKEKINLDMFQEFTGSEKVFKSKNTEKNIDKKEIIEENFTKVNIIQNIKSESEGN